jgi:hypothetical protein
MGLTKTRELTTTIINVLKKSVASRDSDEYLYALVLKEQGVLIENITVADLLRAVYEGKTPSIRTVARLRSFIQSSHLHADLRGKKFNRRHKLQETVKAELQDLEAAI